MTSPGAVPAATASVSVPQRSGPAKPTDPRRVALHRSVRAGLVIPAIFSVSLLVIRDLQIATFTAFGGFGLLVMADFGGRRRPRAVAYASTTLVGALLVALGTAVSPNSAVAAAVMLVLGFILAFAGIFGGYVAAAQTALLLSFVLSASIPASVSAIPARLAGWLFAGTVATLAGVFLWPWFERVEVRRRAAEACVAVANLVADGRRSVGNQPAPGAVAAARAAMAALRRDYAHTSMRPAGPTRRDRAFVQMMTQLEQVVDVSERPFGSAAHAARPCTGEGRRLEEAVIDGLCASGAVLTGGAPPDLRAVEEAARAHRAALDRWAITQLHGGHAPGEVLEGMDVDHTLRVISYVTIALSSNAVIAAGGDADDSLSLPAAVPRLRGPSGVAHRTLRTFRTHLEPSSTVLHNSIRVAVGLAVSVFLARTIGLGHAFWVVLGTLSVLRSNALGTGRTTVQALVGSTIGVVAGGLFASVAGRSPALMWSALPIAVFFASYAASTLGFVVGQAAFTLTVILIFNLISPAGWQVGLVRIEDVGVGTGISVLVGILLWPRGARRDVSRATAAFYRAVAAYLDRAFGMVLRGVETATDVARARAEAVRAGDRAGESFDVFLNERGARPLDPETAGRLITAGSQGLLAGDLLVFVAGDLGYRATACPDGAAAVEAQVRSLLAGTEHLAAQLAGRGGAVAPRPERPSGDALRNAEIQCLRRAGADESATRGAIAVVAAGEWVENLGRIEADLEKPVSAAVEAAGTRWWR